MTQTNPKKRIVSFDLDMTLLDHKTWKIPDSAMRALKCLKEDSVVAIASGRNMDHEMSIMYKELIQPDAVIHMNGTRVEAEGTVLYEHLMDKERLRALLSYGEKNGISVGVSMNGHDYFTNIPGVVLYDKTRWGTSERSFQDVWELMDMPVRTLVYIGGPERIEELESAFPDLKFPMFSGRMGADVVEKEASKAEGLKRLCEYYGIAMEQTVAFGDSMNDYEIIREAGIGIAMGNSCGELKAAADYVTDDIDKDGVWNACRHFGLIG